MFCILFVVYAGCENQHEILNRFAATLEGPGIIRILLVIAINGPAAISSEYILINHLQG